MTDSIILATARQYNAVLWTQDADFEKLPGALSCRGAGRLTNARSLAADAQGERPLGGSVRSRHRAGSIAVSPN